METIIVYRLSGKTEKELFQKLSNSIEMPINKLYSSIDRTSLRRLLKEFYELEKSFNLKLFSYDKDTTNNGRLCLIIKRHCSIEINKINGRNFALIKPF